MCCSGWAAIGRMSSVCRKTKLDDESFPHAEIAAAGYTHCTADSARTTVLSPFFPRATGADVISELPGFDTRRSGCSRSTIAGVALRLVYVPNGESVVSDKYQYKLRWLS